VPIPLLKLPSHSIPRVYVRGKRSSSPSYSWILDRAEIRYHWDFSYFEVEKRTDPPWGYFKSDFIWFHRPLSDYWKAFTAAGFDVVDFEEPRITEDRYHLAETEKQLRNCRTRPYSVAFKLQKKSRTT